MNDTRSSTRSRAAGVSPLRLLWFVLLVVLGNLWVNHHFALSPHVLWIGGAGALFVTVASTLTKGVLDKPEAIALSKSLHAALACATSPEALTGLSVILLAVGFTWSSVSVLPAGATAAEYRIRRGDSGAAVGSGALHDETGTQHGLTTGLGGRPYVLEVDGYRPFQCDVGPFVGRRIRVGADLERLPSLLVRVPLERASNLEAGAVKLYAVEAAGKKKLLAEAATNASQGAVLFGPLVDVPERFLADWRLEIVALGMEAQKTEAFVARAHKLWSRPIASAAMVHLTPGVRLEVDFDVSGDLVSSGTCTMTSGPLRDLLLSDPP